VKKSCERVLILFDAGEQSRSSRNEHESQRGQVQCDSPGGRRPLKSIVGPGVEAIGARTMQEGGAFGSWNRKQVSVCYALV